jgi:hypothetical protein
MRDQRAFEELLVRYMYDGVSEIVRGLRPPKGMLQWCIRGSVSEIITGQRTLDERLSVVCSYFDKSRANVVSAASRAPEILDLDILTARFLCTP